MSTGFLITNLTGKLKRISDTVNQHVLKKLYIYVSDTKNKGKLNDRVSKKIVDMYSSSFHLFPHLDVRIILSELKLKEGKDAIIRDFNVDVIIVPANYEEEISFFKKLKNNIVVIYTDKMIDDEDKVNATPNKIFNTVVLGGTFDRLHTGHKILLSEALLRCSEKLTVGVTDGDLIKGKMLWELILPCEQRIHAVKAFIKEVDASIVCEVVPITDMYGPTKNDPDLDLLVVSSETLKGGLKINELRKSKGLKELTIHVVNLVEDSTKTVMEDKKISSSSTRFNMLGTYLQVPEDKPGLPKWPRIIGLTGGIASGKSKICEYLAQLGAGVINCDKMAHNLYKPGTSIFFKLIELFGNTILSPNGEINRKELGCIVFNDSSKLNELNKLMWPSIFEETFAECKRLFTVEKKKIIFLEAAVLVKAGWENRVHEVWASIIPPAEVILCTDSGREVGRVDCEAIHRLIIRNNLKPEEAILRLEAQSSNMEIVRVSNVIFCSLWDYEVTRQQVDKAWNLLQNKIK